jgi:signal transduction histidine kinase
MAGKSSESLDLFFVIVTVGMILLSLAIISSVFLYQQKLQRRRNQLKNVEIDYQKNLLNASIEAREMEQRRIAFELHDDIGSTLTAIKFSLANALVDESVMTNLNNAIQKVRRISYELLPSILDEMGLLSGATSLVNGLNDQIPHIHFSIQPVRDPQAPEQTKEIELALYRVLQELLNNIVKYSNASTVNVLLIQNELGIELILDDDGDGFDPRSVDKASSSLGLRNMEMRIQQIDGSLKFEKKNNGTRVVVKWEVKKNQ